MNLKNINIGFAITGAFYSFENIIPILKQLRKEEANIIPVMSKNLYKINKNLGKSNEFVERIENVTNNRIINTIEEAEKIGRKRLIDILVVVPCTGNTLGKISNGIYDGPITVAVKSHLRNSNPIVIGIATNDGLSGSAENIGRLLNRANYYFVPFKQDNPITKPRSIIFDKAYVIKTIKSALQKEQIQPILL